MARRSASVRFCATAMEAVNYLSKIYFLSYMIFSVNMPNAQVEMESILMFLDGFKSRIT